MEPVRRNTLGYEVSTPANVTSEQWQCRLNVHRPQCVLSGNEAQCGMLFTPMPRGGQPPATSPLPSGMNGAPSLLDLICARRDRSEIRRLKGKVAAP
jgi:hypothetical protein